MIHRIFVILFLALSISVFGQSINLRVGAGYTNSQTKIVANTMPTNVFSAANSVGFNPQIGITYDLKSADNLYLNLSHFQGTSAISFAGDKKNFIDFFWGGTSYINSVNTNAVQVEMGYEKLIFNKKNKTYLVGGVQLNFSNSSKDSSSIIFVPELGSHNLTILKTALQPGLYFGVKHSFYNKKQKEILSLNAGIQQSFGAMYNVALNYTPVSGPSDYVNKPQRASLEYRGFAFRLGVSFNILSLKKSNK